MAAVSSNLVLIPNQPEIIVLFYVSCCFPLVLEQNSSKIFLFRHVHSGHCGVRGPGAIERVTLELVFVLEGV